jgi:hypothetical protein
VCLPASKSWPRLFSMAIDRSMPRSRRPRSTRMSVSASTSATSRLQTSSAFRATSGNYGRQPGAVRAVHHLIEHAAVRAMAAGLGQAIGGPLKERHGVDEDASRPDFVGALQQQAVGIVEFGLQHLGTGKDKLTLLAS